MDNFEELKRKVAALNTRYDQIEGAEGELAKRAKKEFGCSTLAEAKAKLSKLEKKERQVAVEITADVEKFEEEFAEQLNEVEDA